MPERQVLEDEIWARFEGRSECLRESGDDLEHRTQSARDHCRRSTIPWLDGVLANDHLKRRRMDLRMQQKHLATALGVSPWTLRLWETGRTEPMVRQWPGIIRFLGYDPAPVPISLSARLKAARRRLGLSQRG